MLPLEDPKYMLINKRTLEEAKSIPQINISLSLERILQELSFVKILNVFPDVSIYHIPLKGGIYVSTRTQIYEEESVADGLILFIGLDSTIRMQLQKRTQIEFQEINT